MEPFDHGAMLAKIAYAEATAAAFVIPAAWPIVATIFIGQCDPGQVQEGGSHWFKVGEKLFSASTAVQDEIDKLPQDDWKGEDRRSFEIKLKAYADALMTASVYAFIVGTVLWALAIALLAYILFYLLIASALAVLAALIAVLLCSVVGAPFAAEIMADAEAAVAEMELVLTDATELLTTFTHVCTGIIGVGLLGDILGQLDSGQFDVGGELVQSVVDMKDDLVKGTLARLARDATAHSMGAPFPKAIPKLGGKSTPGFLRPFGGIRGLGEVFGNGDSVF